MVPTCIKSVNSSLLTNFQGDRCNYSKLPSQCYSLPGKHYLTKQCSDAVPTHCSQQ